MSDWPVDGWVEDVRPALRVAVEAGRPCVLATLYAIDGPAPRDPGAQMLFDGSDYVGFFSGGCVEADIALHAAETLADGQPRRLVYGEGSPFWDVRLICGGRIEVLLERVAPDDLAAAALLAAERERRPVLWRTDGVRRRCTPSPRSPALRWTAAPFSVERRVEPPWRLAVVGGDPIALAIAALAARTGLKVTLVRPKGPDEPPPLAGVAYDRREPAAALRALGLDPWTAVAVATHALEEDEAALAEALPSAAGYVGVLGAARRLPERLARLQALGVPETALARLRAPIGLPLGGKTPWTVATAVVAEVLQAFHAARAEAPVAEPA